MANDCKISDCRKHKKVRFDNSNQYIGQNEAVDYRSDKEYYDTAVESQHSGRHSWNTDAAYKSAYEEQNSDYYANPAVNKSSYNSYPKYDSAAYPHSYPKCDPPAQTCNYSKCDTPAQICNYSKCGAPMPAPVEEICPEEHLPVSAHCPAYDYLTFNQFREIKELLKVSCKHFFRFLFLLVFIIFYFLIASCIMIWLIEKLQIGFERGSTSCDSDACSIIPAKVRTCTRDRNIWDALRPRTSDLWRQCF
ncbi:hypothetical protein WDU94_008006 [Cyamophila willieti]